MTILDTNVLSQLIKPETSHQVVTWVHSRETTAISALTVSETLDVDVIARLAHGRRRSALGSAATALWSWGERATHFAPASLVDATRAAHGADWGEIIHLGHR